MSSINPQKYLFLDMDGVLATIPALAFGRPIGETGPLVPHTCCEQRVRMLSRFVHENDFKVIMCTAWRKDPEFNFSAEAFSDYFKHQYGVMMPVVDCTIEHPSGWRGDEIRDAIVRHKIESYVILDDCNDFHLDQVPNHVRVFAQDGLLFSDLVRVTEIMRLKNSLTVYIRGLYNPD